MSYVSRISRKIGDKTNPLLAKGRREKLTRTDFSIFSNNCWAGSVYRRYGLAYSSPTAGLYFFASDYVKFASRLRHYTAAPLEFIDARESLHADQLREKGELGKPLPCSTTSRSCSSTIPLRRKPQRSGPGAASGSTGTTSSSNSVR